MCGGVPSRRAADVHGGMHVSERVLCESVASTGGCEVAWEQCMEQCMEGGASELAHGLLRKRVRKVGSAGSDGLCCAADAMCRAEIWRHGHTESGRVEDEVNRALCI